MPVRRLLLAVALCNLPLISTPGSAHEFWIAPRAAVVAPGGSVTADLRSGVHLEGDPYPYLPARFLRLEIVEGGVARPVHATIGDLPAVRTRASGPGLLRIVYHSRPSTLLHTGFGPFAAYASDQGLDDVVERHRRRGLPETGFVEAFSRCAKALVAAGDGDGRDDPVGLPLEVVVDTNPYRLGPSDPVTVRLLWHGEPLPGAQLSVFRRAADGTVDVNRLRTDRAGRVVVAADPGFFMLSAVHMIEADPALAAETGAVWHSVWASATFTRGDGEPPSAAGAWAEWRALTAVVLAAAALASACAWGVRRNRHSG